MKVAFPALVLIVVLVWPGILLRGVATANLPRQARSVIDRLFDSVALAMAIHLVSMLGLELWASVSPFDWEWHVDLGQVLMVMMERGEPEALTESAAPIVTYFAIQSVCMVALGLVIRKWLMQDTWLGRVLQWLFQVQLEWILLWSKPDVAVYLSTVVDTETGSYLYHGLVVDVFWNRDGHVEAVALFDASRRRMEHDKRDDDDPNPRFYRIAGDRLLIKYADMITVNFTYIRVHLPSQPARWRHR